MRLSDEPIEVKKYRKNIRNGRLPHPTCGARNEDGTVCGRRAQRRGSRWRTEVWTKDGGKLHPLEIVCFRCAVHGTVPWLPWFLARYIRYLARVVDRVLCRYAENTVNVEELMEDPGPDISTLYRWIRRLLGPLILSWLREKLDGVAVESSREGECSRSQVVRVIRAGKALASKHAPTPEALDFSPYLQLARLASL